MPRATAHIGDMVRLIETLIERGHAYRTDDGSVFFRIASWPAYGRLARLDPERLRPGERVADDEYDKDDVRDFALWKAAKPGEPSWSTPVGDGRPGWHIECSAMSMRYLGESFDIHTGGVDLIFPHHEDEIAQSEAATGVPFVRTWLHCAHLQMGGQKMAKRVGNLARPAELYERGVSPAGPALRPARDALPLAARVRRREPHRGHRRGRAPPDRRCSRSRPTRSDRADDPSLPGALEAARAAFGDGARRRPEHLGGARRRSSTSCATSTRGSPSARCRRPMPAPPRPRCSTSTASSA